MSESDERHDQWMRQLLDRGWTEADLRLAAQLLAQCEADAQALATLRSYDQIRDAMTPQELDAEPAGGWGGFEQSLVDRPFDRRRASGWRLPLGVAAACLLVMVGWWSAGFFYPPSAIPTAGHDVGGVQTVRHPAVYPPAQIDEQVGLFTQVSQVFDERAGWVALANGTSELGLAAQPIGEAKRLLLLRLVMSRRGEVVSQADVAILPGQSAELSLPMEYGNTLHYQMQISQQRPLYLMLMAELQRPGDEGQTLAALAADLQPQQGQTRAGGQLVTRAADYELRLDFYEASLERI